MRAKLSKEKQLLGGIRYVEVIPKLGSGKINRRQKLFGYTYEHKGTSYFRYLLISSKLQVI